jgi:hypothetical protein
MDLVSICGRNHNRATLDNTGERRYYVDTSNPILDIEKLLSIDLDAG